MSDIEHLLQPTLSARHSPARLYSTGALFWVAFLGGGFGALIMAYLNSKQLDRVGDDARWWILLAIAFTGAVAGLMGLAEAGYYVEAIGASRTVRYGSRAAALAIWGVVALIHRPFHRTSDIAGLDDLPPWKTGFLCVIGGATIHFIVVLVLRGFVFDGSNA